MQVAAIIVAGGRGERLGGSVPKQLISIAGRQVLERSVDAFLACPVVGTVVVVLPPWLGEPVPPYLMNRLPPVLIARGGPRRQDSVANGVEALGGRADVVVVHDAARPFVTPQLIERTIAAAAECGAAIAALPARDTVKLGSAGFVEGTIPRESVYLAQTPQAFTWEVLQDVLRLGRDGSAATDEAALAEMAGHRVRLVEGGPRNIKITTSDDLALARALGMDEVGRPAARAGIGNDLHRLVEGRPLVLGGLTIPFDRGPAGHSDGDVVCHAVTDAILGAAAAGDIGSYFPDTDETWRGASSVGLLERAVAIVAGRGFRVVNVDVVVMTERPRLAPYIAEMSRRLAAALGIPTEAVGLKAKTGEGIGEIGRGEAIAAQAVALLGYKDPAE